MCLSINYQDKANTQNDRFGIKTMLLVFFEEYETKMLENC